MRFLISSRREGMAHTLVLHGELDVATGTELHKALEDAVREPAPHRLIIDLGDVTFLDCAGIGVLVYGRRLAEEAGLRYSICNARDTPLLVLQLAGIPMCPSAAPVH